MSLTREAELALLIAEQEEDARAGHRVRSMGKYTLDTQVGEDGSTLAEFVGEEDSDLLALIGGNETARRIVHDDHVSEKDIGSWWYARYRRKWTLDQIADHFGTTPKVVRYHLKKKRRRETELTARLEAKLPIARSAYERGARLIDIGAELYEEIGYSSPESCYQALRKLFRHKGVPIRPKTWKHGMRSRTASREQYEAYWRTQNAKAKARRHARLNRCPAITREGTRCKRWAIEGRAFCVNHNADTRRKRRWSAYVICDALRVWVAIHGVPPKPADWTHATAEHPNFKTVYDVFGSWPSALDAALTTQVEAAA